MAKVVSAIDGYQLHWLATASMRDELAHTLLLPALKRWKPDVAQMLETFDARVRLLPEPVCPPPQRLWCSDNDDQVFIDLALTQRARWLLSKDRALLKLARKARALGVLVTPPARWAAGG